MSGKKIAIVTGASSGMGREMVYLLADHFAALEEIWVIARRKDRLEELVGKVPVSLRILSFDLSREEDLRMLSGLLKQEQPNVKILVNGAGYGKTGAAGTIPRGLWYFRISQGTAGSSSLPPQRRLCRNRDSRSTPRQSPLC